MCWHFTCLQISTFCIFVSLLEHYQGFPRKDVCLIFVLAGVYQEILFLGPNTLPREQEVYHVLYDMIFEDHAIQYHPCCQLISRITSLQCGEY